MMMMRREPKHRRLEVNHREAEARDALGVGSRGIVQPPSQEGLSVVVEVALVHLSLLPPSFLAAKPAMIVSSPSRIATYLAAALFLFAASSSAIKFDIPAKNSPTTKCICE